MSTILPRSAPRTRLALRLLGSFIGLFGVFILLGQALAFRVLQSASARPAEGASHDFIHASFLVIGILFVLFAAWSIWIAWAVSFRFAPLAVRAVCGWCCLFAVCLVLMLSESLLSRLSMEPGASGLFASVLLLVLLIGMPTVYLQTSRRLVAWLFPTEAPTENRPGAGAGESQPAASEGPTN